MNALFVRSRLLAAALVAAGSLASGSALAQDPVEPQSPPAPPPAPPPATAPAEPPAKTQPAERSDLPKATEILDRALEAMGGRKAFEEMTSCSTKGEVTTPMGNFTLEMHWMKPSFVLVKQAGQGIEVSIGSNSEVTWAKGPMGFEILDADQAKQIQQQSNMFRMVLRMESDYKDHKTVDQLKFAERDCHKVAMTSNEGQLQYAYFDVEDHLLRGVETSEDTPMGEMTVVARFSEWKEDSGVRYFTKMEMDQMGMTTALTLTEVKFNTLEPSMFELPEEVKAMLKDSEAPATQPGAGTQPAAGRPGH